MTLHFGWDTRMHGKTRSPEIFDVFTTLRGKLPWLPLGDFPTPIHRLKRLGHANLWIKRDDLSSPVYGGNKVRKLEFILADVKQKNKTHVVTCGGVGTHHGLATTIFGNHLGLKTTLLLYNQPVSPDVRENLLLMQKYKTRLLYKKTLLRVIADFYIFQRIRHPKAYFLFPGGSNTTGTIGYVNAVFELKRQIEQGLLPQPDVVFCPVGTNGTQAGLFLGVRLAGLPIEVIGVRVSISRVGPFAAATPAKVKGLMKATLKHLEGLSGKLPLVTIPEPRMQQSYYGRGYGYPTPAGKDAARAMQDREKISLDQTYTAKTFAAVIDYCARNPKKTVLFWNTYNSVDLSSKAASVDHRTLPESLQKFID